MSSKFQHFHISISNLFPELNRFSASLLSIMVMFQVLFLSLFFRLQSNLEEVFLLINVLFFFCLVILFIILSSCIGGVDNKTNILSNGLLLDATILQSTSYNTPQMSLEDELWHFCYKSQSSWQVQWISLVFAYANINFWLHRLSHLCSFHNALPTCSRCSSFLKSTSAYLFFSYYYYYRFKSAIPLLLQPLPPSHFI